MGGGAYSYADRTVRATNIGLNTKSAKEIFTNFEISNQMSPMNVMLRESRDSAEHPNSEPIIIALDETGSMEKVPEQLIRDAGIAHIMDQLIQRGIADPQVLFCGIGDHECDTAPFQVGQFESSDPLLDKWLTDIYLEGNGGGNEGESYLLAWYFAGHRTALDSLEKRGRKGNLFTIGDEPTLMRAPAEAMRRIFGGQHSDYTAGELLAKAREMYNVYHLHIMETMRGKRGDTIEGWQGLIGPESLITIQGYHEIPRVITDIVIRNSAVQANGPVPEPAVDPAGTAGEPGASGYVPGPSGM